MYGTDSVCTESTSPTRQRGADTGVPFAGTVSLNGNGKSLVAGGRGHAKNTGKKGDAGRTEHAVLYGKNRQEYRRISGTYGVGPVRLSEVTGRTGRQVSDCCTDVVEGRKKDPERDCSGLCCA